MHCGKHGQVVLPAPACYCTGINSTPQHLGHAWHVFLCVVHDEHALQCCQFHALALECSTGKSRHDMLHLALHVAQNLSDLRTRTLIFRMTYGIPDR